MRPEDLQPWITIIRDLLIVPIIAVIAVVLRQKWSSDVDKAEREKLSKVARDAVLYADQLAQSQWDPTTNDGPSKKAKALQFALSRVEGRREDIDRQIEAELSKLKKGIVGPSGTVFHADSLNLNTIPPPAPVPKVET